MSFFSYIDEKRYVVKNKLPGSACDQYEILENDLPSIVPIVSGETENLNNLFHITPMRMITGKGWRASHPSWHCTIMETIS